MFLELGAAGLAVSVSLSKGGRMSVLKAGEFGTGDMIGVPKLGAGGDIALQPSCLTGSSTGEPVTNPLGVSFLLLLSAFLTSDVRRRSLLKYVMG